MRLQKADSEGAFTLTDTFDNEIPPYAVLSHTWGEDEVSFRDLEDGAVKHKSGYRKIQFCGEQANRDNLQYIWVDTCCIDKSSSTEVSEAITSMFRWYQNAAKCYVFLSDVSVVKRKANSGVYEFAWESAFRKSRWFTRGWTLQELLAPTSVEFFSKEGMFLGDRTKLEQQVHEITGISRLALQGVPLGQFSIDERFSWSKGSKGRRTKRVEDEVYSLLGIFQVFMLPIYGEGKDSAMLRLLKKLPDADAGKEHLPTQKRREILESLGFHLSEIRRDQIKTAHAMTCEWLLKTSEYQDWLNDKKISDHLGFLWIKGKPGAGKSTMMKFAFSKAQRSTSRNPIISFFFNAKGEYLERTTLGMYRSLLFQLLKRVPKLQEVLDPLDSRVLREDHEWSTETVMALFESAVKNLGHCVLTCFIDALDECEENQIREMVKFMELLGQNSLLLNIRFRVCFSSRHYPTIRVEKSVQLVLENQEGHQQDIKNYIHGELSNGKDKQGDLVKAEILERASGVFLWVYLVVKILKEEFDKGRIHALRKRLNEIPDGLDELFQDILTRDGQNVEELILSLQWVLYAKRPLSIEELYFAVLAGSAPETLGVWDSNEITTQDMERFVLNSSKGFVESVKSISPSLGPVDSAPQTIVQFIHESVREFFLKADILSRLKLEHRSNFLGTAHEQLMQCCQKYIHSSEYSAPRAITPEGNWLRASTEAGKENRRLLSNRYPFLEYATCHILYHADAASQYGAVQDSFVQSFSFKEWIQFYNVFKPYRKHKYTTDASALYIFADHDAPNLIRIALTQTSCMNIKGQHYKYPLYVALAGRNAKALRALLAPQTDHDIHCQTSSASTEFEYALEFLLENSRMICKHKHQTLLCWTASEGLTSISKLLLETGRVDASLKDGFGRTPLSYAAESQNYSLVQTLLENRANANIQDRRGGTPLLYAVQQGSLSIVRLLLENRVKVDPRDRSGRTPLSFAIELGDRKIVQRLLVKGAKIGTKDKKGRTPLCSITDLKMLKYLIHKGANIEAKDGSGRTPLSWAAGQGSLLTTQCLLRGGASTENGDERGQTALWWAAKNGHARTVKRLLRKGANIESCDPDRCSPLSWAVSQGHKKVVQLLLDSGADVGARDKGGWTPLFWAIAVNDRTSAQLLLEKGAVVEVQDVDGRTPLWWAVKRANSFIVPMLIERGASIENHYQNGESLLSMALKDSKVVPKIDHGHWMGGFDTEFSESTDSIPDLQTRKEQLMTTIDEDAIEGCRTSKAYDVIYKLLSFERIRSKAHLNL